MRALHDERAVFSSRHLPSWLLLAAAGGTVNAIGFVAHARFVTHVTGTISSFGMAASGGKLAFESAFILLCLTILTVLAVLGATGVFGVFGDGDETRSFLFLSALSFAMGLQNAAVAAATRLIVRTTHMTGAATDLGLHLGTAFRSTGDERRASFRQAALRAGKMAAFTIGAAAGAILAARFGFLALALPAVAVALATVSSFVASPARAGVTMVAAPCRPVPARIAERPSR